MKVVFRADTQFPPVAKVVGVDREPYLSGELPSAFTWAARSVHTIDVYSEVDTGTGTRLAFTSWGDGDKSASRAVSHGGEYTAGYKTQCNLTIESAYGDSMGEG